MKIVATLLAVGAALAQADSTFFDDFTGSTLNTTAWELATWANGAPFGCTFTKSEAVVANGQLNLNLNGADKTCAEARTWKEFTYGKFATRMKPSAIQGADSSFFLYTGTAGTSTHYEIDIEYINAGKTLHTNVWVQGKPNELNLPSDGNWVTVGFEWTKDYVRWFSSDGVKETELRRVSTNVPAAMRLMMNHWNGDNAQDTKSWLGTYNGDNGVAQYDWVKVVDVVPQPQPSATTTTPQPSTTTTAPPTTTAAPTPAPSSTTKAPAGSVAKWGQCGGIGYQGAITCAEGTCKKLNDYYSQCQ